MFFSRLSTAESRGGKKKTTPPTDAERYAFHIKSAPRHTFNSVYVYLKFNQPRADFTEASRGNIDPKLDETSQGSTNSQGFLGISRFPDGRRAMKMREKAAPVRSVKGLGTSPLKSRC